MKTTAILAFLFMGVNIAYIEAYVEEIKYLYNTNLKPDEPLKVSTFYPKLYLSNATGSIGLATFSKIQHIIGLEIEESTIDLIEDGALCSLPNLEVITLNKPIKFPVLTLSLLGNCNKIKSLTLGSMQMEPNALQNMSSLESLTIREHNISHLTRVYMQPLKNLNSLEFFGCKFDEIDGGAICSSPSLKILKLHGTDIPMPLTKSVFENCNSVTHFFLVYNSHVDIEEEVFSGLVSAIYVVIDNLKIETLTKGYLSGLSNVEQLKIENSSFTKINNDTFDDFRHVKRLTLQDNRISEIGKGALSSLLSLEMLDISKNKLTSLDNIANPTLETLYAHRNSISKIDAEVIKENLPKLTNLALNENNISREDAAQLKEELIGIHVFY